MKPENSFIQGVHRHLPTALYRMKNNNMFNSGIADVWYSGVQTDMWIEYKYVARMPAYINFTDRKKAYSLTALQEEWLLARHREGRKVAVILGCKEGGAVFEDDNWSTDGAYPLSDFDTTIQSRMDIAKWIALITQGRYEAPVRRRKGAERCV